MLFEEKLNKLNKQQRQAVEAIEGPVMVIAGPGTGKTEILSLRIGYILKNTVDTPPGRYSMPDLYTMQQPQKCGIALLITSARKPIASRSAPFIVFAISSSRRIHQNFSKPGELEPISDIDKFKLIQELIDSFSADHPLKRFKGQTYTDWKRLDELFTTMKKENWSPAYLHQQIDHYIAEKESSDEYRYKRNGPTYKAGDLKPDFKTKVLDRMAALKAAVQRI
jgi:DNA helicase-2/ATP-dependent DNA helicase PcrA